ncbi:MAG: Crp/Fnr family transcriptional regulator [Vicinamibacterales bacterium]
MPTPPADADAVVAEAFRTATIFRKVSPEDRQRLSRVARVASYVRGDLIFSEGDPSDAFYTITRGRVKIFKMLPTGKEVILEIFGTGDPLGAIAAYEGRPFPASATALEDTTCLILPRAAFFALLEQNPTLVRGLLYGMTQRLVELTNRLAELSSGRVEARLARLFLKLAESSGRAERGGLFVPLALSRQELADMTGTTIETCIRIMSRWGKQEVLLTEKEGFLVKDREVLEAVANS